MMIQRIDAFCHVVPERYRKALYRKAQRSLYPEDLESHHNAVPLLFDMGRRFRAMDQYEGMRQVLTIASPPLEAVVRPDDAVQLAKLANEETAELVDKYPDRFVAGVACLPMNDMDSALSEAERAMKVLKLKGVQIYTPCDGKALDSQELMPLYEMMEEYDLPIWLHPTRDRNTPDYKDETHSKYLVFQTVGWPYETTVAMVRLVLSGVLERHPSLKIITHHCGGMVPHFAERLRGSLEKAAKENDCQYLSRPPIEYLKMFYGDTALSGCTQGLMCGYAFFGAKHMLLGTDMPFGDLDKKIASVDQMPITESDRYHIFEGNAKRLLHI